ncbi:ERF family protein [Nocardia transvalensis]|uniref:ERF family protein n=1 Tax=Nocardia transvalensis TaxID=37333 RepID=UPI001896007A|nr:ERF family protein [Nocardia transvalensis]MBF6330838.1 ERF family protein [Nocardia transvalensis]
MNVYQTVAEVMREVGAVRKDQKNLAQKFSFRGVDQVVNACAGPMRNHGLIVAPIGTNLDVREITSGGGKRQAWVTGTVQYGVYGPEGDRMADPIEAGTEATDFADKATAKAMSVAYRIALLQLFNLPTDDPDPDSEYVERSATKKEPQPGSPAAKAREIDAKKKAAAKAKPNDTQVIRDNIFAECKARNLSPDDLRAKWAEVGGTGKITECTDESQLAALLSAIILNGDE